MKLDNLRKLTAGEAIDWLVSSESYKYELEKTWIEFNGDNYPENYGKYLVKSSYGICLASYHEWGGCFQDLASNNDEGMEDSSGKEFEVYAWKELAK